MYVITLETTPKDLILTTSTSINEQCEGIPVESRAHRLVEKRKDFFDVLISTSLSLFVSFPLALFFSCLLRFLRV